MNKIVGAVSAIVIAAIAAVLVPVSDADAACGVKSPFNNGRVDCTGQRLSGSGSGRVYSDGTREIVARLTEGSFIRTQGYDGLLNKIPQCVVSEVTPGGVSGLIGPCQSAAFFDVTGAGTIN